MGREGGAVLAWNSMNKNNVSRTPIIFIYWYYTKCNQYTTLACRTDKQTSGKLETIQFLTTTNSFFTILGISRTSILTHPPKYPNFPWGQNITIQHASGIPEFQHARYVNDEYYKNVKFHNSILEIINLCKYYTRTQRLRLYKISINR